MSLITDLKRTVLESDQPIRSDVENASVITGELSVLEGAAEGLVLTSDSIGNATWQPIPESEGAIPQVVDVNTAPLSSQFSSIVAAMASITDASATNRYVVRVAPGVYIEEGIVVKPFVSVRGFGRTATIVQTPVLSTTDVFALSDDSGVFGLTITGATAVGVAAVSMSVAGRASASDIGVEGVDVGFRIAASGGNTTNCNLSQISGKQTVATFVEVTTDGASVARAVAMQVTFCDTATGVSPLLFLSSGMGADLVLSVADISRGEGVAPFGVMSRAVQSGHILAVNIDVAGFPTLFEAPADGGVPRLQVSGIATADALTFLDAPNPSIEGYMFSNVGNLGEITIDPAAPFHISNRDNRTVLVSAKGGDFGTIEDALAYVTLQSPSITSLWQVLVGAGSFTVANPVVVPRFVSIRGASLTATNVFASVATAPIFELSGSRIDISDMRLANASGVGGAGVLYEGEVPDATSSTVTLRNVIVQNCETAFSFVNTNGNVNSQFYNCSDIVVSTSQRYGVRSQAVNTTWRSLVYLSEYNTMILPTISPTVTLPYTAVSMETLAGAPMSSLAISTFIASQSGAVSTGSTAIALNNAILAATSISVQRFAVALDVVASTLPVQLAVVSLLNVSSTLAVRVANNSAFGTVAGVFDQSDVDDSAAPLNTVTYLLQKTNGGIAVTGSLEAGETIDSTTNYLPGLNYNVTPGLQTGGALSSPGGLSVEVAAGTGYVTTGAASDPLQFLEWTSPLSGAVPANSDRFVSVIAGAPATLQLTAGEPDDYNAILVGRVKSDATSILYQQNINTQALHASTLVNNTLRDAFGPIVSNGLIGSAGTGGFQVTMTSGRYFFGTHEYTPTGGTDLTFTEYFHSGGSFTQGAPTNQLSAAEARRWDDGNALVALPVGQWVKHVLYIINDGADEYYAFVYGQETFATQSLAENGQLPLPPPYFGQNFATLAALVLASTSTDWETVQDVRPTLQFTGSGVTVTTDHGSLSGLLDDDHPQYLLVNGTRAMTGALDMGGNNITTSGTINGVDVENLSGRLQPGGADELPTGVPTAIATANNIGSSTSLARADHVHAHGMQTDATLHATATGAANGFMASTDKSKLDASTALSTSSTLVERDGSGEVAVNGVTLDSGGAVQFANAGNTFHTSVRALAGLTANYTLTLPPNDGINGQVLQTNGSGVLTWVTPSGIEEYVAVDSKSQNTESGTATSGSWFTRTLNFLTSVGGSNVSLSSNVLTLQPGSWKIFAQVPCFRTERSQARLFNVTAGSTLRNGMSYHARENSDPTNGTCTISHVWTIGSATDYRIEQRVSQTRLNNGRGHVSNFTTEIYTTVSLTKFA